MYIYIYTFNMYFYFLLSIKHRYMYSHVLLHICLTDILTRTVTWCSLYSSTCCYPTTSLSNHYSQLIPGAAKQHAATWMKDAPLLASTTDHQSDPGWSIRCLAYLWWLGGGWNQLGRRETNNSWMLSVTRWLLGTVLSIQKQMSRYCNHGWSLNPYQGPKRLIIRHQPLQ